MYFIRYHIYYIKGKREGKSIILLLKTKKSKINTRNNIYNSSIFRITKSQHTKNLLSYSSEILTEIQLKMFLNQKLNLKKIGRLLIEVQLIAIAALEKILEMNSITHTLRKIQTLKIQTNSVIMKMNMKL